MGVGIIIVLFGADGTGPGSVWALISWPSPNVMRGVSMDGGAVIGTVDGIAVIGAVEGGAVIGTMEGDAAIGTVDVSAGASGFWNC